MQSLLALSRGIDAITEKLGRALCWLLLAAVVISTVNAITRKAFNLSSNTYLEAQWYLFAAPVLFHRLDVTALLDHSHRNQRSVSQPWRPDPLALVHLGAFGLQFAGDPEFV